MNYVIRQEIIDIIFCVVKCEKIEISDETTFIDDLGFDSVSIINFIALIEKEFNLQFDMNDDLLEIFFCIGNLERYLESAMNNE